METFSIHNALGAYDNRVEFQVDTTLVWIMCKVHERSAAFAAANAMFPDICAATSGVVALAEQAITERGISNAMRHVRFERAIVRDVWIDATAGTTEFEVWFVPSSEEPLDTEDVSVAISRSASGQLLVDKVWGV